MPVPVRWQAVGDLAWRGGDACRLRRRSCRNAAISAEEFGDRLRFLALDPQRLAYTARYLFKSIFTYRAETGRVGRVDRRDLCGTNH